MFDDFFGHRNDLVRREVFDEMVEEKDRIITLQARDMDSLKREIISLKKELSQSKYSKRK